MSETTGYPSLQSGRSFDRVEDAVPVLDAMVLRLRLLSSSNQRAIRRLEALPVKRRHRLLRDRIVADLRCEADKTVDTLSVYGFIRPKP